MVRIAEHCSTPPEGCSEYLLKLVFSDECMPHLNSAVNRQNVRIWGVQRPGDHSPVVMNSPSALI